MQPEHPRTARPGHGQSREIAELRQLRVSQPDLAAAVDLQIDLLQLQQRVRSRLSLPWLDFDAAWLRDEQLAGRPVLRFESIPLDWTDVRLMFRQTADILHRHDILETTAHARLQALARDGHALEPIVVRWYTDTAEAGRAETAAQKPAAAVTDLDPDTLDQVVTLALHPFLERSADVLQQRIDFSSWSQPYCPVCGGAPEFAAITPAAERLLLCSRCSARWHFHSMACPYCRNDVPTLITSFTSRDGHYRLYACDVCRRYLKAHDGRRAARPVMLAVDAIATLPLDAAAIQRGYRS